MTERERDSAIRYLLGAIIKSRHDGNFPSNYYTFDEDVNVYLAHLLFAVALPEYHEMATPYLSMDTSDILNWVRSTQDRTIRYLIFKVNADHILLHSGIFDDLLSRGPRQKIYRRSERHYQELAKLYYDQAASYHKRIHRRRTGVVDVLLKLSHYFEAYQSLLRLVKRDYFDFVHSFRDQAFSHFVREINQFEKRSDANKSMDQFLDLYSEWLRTRNPELELKIRQVVEDLKRLDPRFRFEPDHVFGQGGSFDERKCA